MSVESEESFFEDDENEEGEQGDIDVDDEDTLIIRDEDSII